MMKEKIMLVYILVYVPYSHLSDETVVFGVYKNKDSAEKAVIANLAQFERYEDPLILPYELEE